MPLFNLPAAAPLSEQTQQYLAEQPAPRLRRRLAAFIYEGVLLFGLVMLVGTAYSVTSNQRHGLHGRAGMMASLFLGISVYFLWFWTNGGQTLAAKTWHVRIISADGRPLRLVQALKRYMLSWLWLLPPWAGAWFLGFHHGQALFATTAIWVTAYALLSKLLPQGQFLHDVISGTKVVDARIQPAGA